MDVRELGEGPKTFEHPNHGDVKTEPACDVCNGKKTLEAFVKEKIDREAKIGSLEKKKDGHRDRSRERHKSSSRRKHTSSHRDDKHSSSRHSSSRRKHTSSHRDDKHSSSRHSSSRHSSSKHSSSKSHSSSRHKDTSGDKDSSSTRDKHKSGDQESSKHKSGDKDSSSRRKHSSGDKDSSRPKHSSGDKDSSRSGDKDSSRSGDKDSSRHKHSSGSKESSRHKHSSSSKDKDRHRDSSDKDKKRHKSGTDKNQDIKKSPSIEVPVVGSTQEKLDTSNAETEKVQDKLRQAEDIIKKARQETSKLNQQFEEKLANSSSGSQGQGMLEEPSFSPELNDSLDIDIDIPLYDDKPMGVFQRTSSTEAEVSSTVVIKTPEHSSTTPGDDHPAVWEGQVIMQDVSKFSVTAHQVSGTSDYLTLDLSKTMTLVGRIPPKLCWDYIIKIKQNPQKEILVLRLQPQNNDEKVNYIQFFSYLQTRSRFGVVEPSRQTVKDCYIMPLSSGDPVPACLLPFDGPGLEPNRANILLAILVRTRRKRAGDPPIPAVPSKAAKVHKPPPPPLPTDDANNYLPTDKRLAPPPPTSDPDDLPYSPEDNEPYSPPDGIADSDDYLTSIQVKTEEPYTPSSVADGGGYKTAMDMVTTQTATNVTGDQSHPEKMSDSSGGFTEKLAKLQAEVAAKKAELAMREASLGMNVAHKPAMPLSSRPNQQFSSAFSTDVMEKNKSGIDLAALPQPITNILFGGGPPGPLNKTPLPPKLPMPPLPMQMPMGGHQMGASFTQPQQSSLNRMSDAELIAKAEAMDMPGHGRGPLPPPGPGMPGNLQGQGIGNIALMEQMEMEGQREEDMRNMASYQMGDQGRFQEGGWDNERWEVERGGYENSRGQQQGVWDKPRQFDMERGRGGRGDWGGEETKGEIGLPALAWIGEIATEIG